jgi:hypothetical protein
MELIQQLLVAPVNEARQAFGLAALRSPRPAT